MPTARQASTSIAKSLYQIHFRGRVGSALTLDPTGTVSARLGAQQVCEHAPPGSDIADASMSRIHPLRR